MARNKKIECFLCFGRGRIWTQDSCPIEGNKMRDSMVCPLCNGKSIHAPENEPLLAAAKIYGLTLRKKQKKIEKERQKKYAINRRITLEKELEEIKKELGEIDG